MLGLAPHTGSIFDKISRLECIKPYILVGGTALSLQIENRQSEDLDFMRWRTCKAEKMIVDWYKIQQELTTIAPIEHMNLMDIDHVEFIVSGVKVSFYASPRYSPVSAPMCVANNLYVADLLAIGAMKMEVMMRRTTFRDYYDIYSLLQAGVDFHAMVDAALKYSGHLLHTKNLYAMLTDGARFAIDDNFRQMQPKYAVTAKEIENYLRAVILT
ncbi:MAG: nucleotidyl transferase AbiEii/AbiGii toxin family protein [Paludibacteraceae bacterium]